MKWVIPFMAMFGVVACSNTREDWCAINKRIDAELAVCNAENRCTTLEGESYSRRASAEAKVRCEWKDRE